MKAMWAKFSVLAIGVLLLGTVISYAAVPTLNILVMPCYDEEQVLKPFEEQYGVKVNVKVYSTSDDMFAILTAAKPGDWDIATPDTPWIQKLYDTDLIDPLNPAEFPAISDFFTRWQQFDQCYVGDQMYGIVSHFGFYGIVYNSKYVDAKKTETIGVLWDPKYKGKVTLFDWYLPNMGMFGRYLGYAQPYDIAGGPLEALKGLLFSLRPQIGLIAATNTDTLSAFAQETGWIGFGGKWLQVLLNKEGYPIELTVPKEGGVSWTEALVLLKGSKNPDLAKKLIEYYISPEGQARIASAQAFNAPVPNKRAVDHMDAELVRLLSMSEAEMESILARIATRKIPANEEYWKQIWLEFKAGVTR